MKTKQLFLSASVLLMAGALSITGCRKEKEPTDNDTSGASDNALAEKSFEDIGQISNEAASGSMSSYRTGDYQGPFAPCATITHDTVLNKITVDFGSTNCLCYDGRYRRGKLFISYNNAYLPEPYTYWDTLTQISITTADPSDGTNSYFVNDHQVIGTKTVTNKGHNLAGHMNWDVNVSGQIIKPSGQGTITWTSTRNREWLQGESTPTWTDDVYGITGSASGTSASGNPFNAVITSQIIRKLSCRWFSAGTFDFTPGTKPTRHVDFSPPSGGACDNVAVVTINGHPYTIYMN